MILCRYWSYAELRIFLGRGVAHPFVQKALLQLKEIELKGTFFILFISVARI